MFNGKLDNERGGHLLQELWAVQSLVKEMHRMVERWNWTSIDGYPMLAVSAGATERLHKLCFGLYRLGEVGEWPAREIKGIWRHDIAGLHSHLMAALFDNLGRATSTVWISTVVERVQKDPFIYRWLELLTVYADQGRYEHLNVLGGRKGPSPQNLLEQLGGDLGPTPFPTDVFCEQAWRANRNQRLLTSIENWQAMYGYAMAHGVFGDDAKSLGLELVTRPDGTRID